MGDCEEKQSPLSPDSAPESIIDPIELNNETTENVEEKAEKAEKIEKAEEDRVATDNSLPPSAAWKRGIQEPSKCITQFQVSYGQIMKLVGLGLRMKNFVAKTRREGREPFMDPFYQTNVTTSRGVPCGGIGCGTLSRSYTGEFNCFYLNPGRPHFGTVKANQFSLYVKREELPSQAVVLGDPYHQSSKTAKTPTDTILMPHTEPLPPFITDKLSEEVDNDPSGNEIEEDQAISTDNVPKSENTPSSQEKQVPKSIPTSKKTSYIRPEAALKDWNWKKVQGEYHGLFPRAWTTYDVKDIDKRLEITCKQISPVIPDNYKESSFPCSVFVWTIENTHPQKSIDVSLMFTFQNGTGEVSDYTGGHVNQPFRSNEPNGDTIGVELIHSRVKECVEGDTSIPYQDPLSFGMATAQAEKIDGDVVLPYSSQLSSATTFQTTGHGDLLWKSFSLTGKAIVPERSATASIEGIGIGSAVANKVHIEANSTVEITFSLAWDQPIIRFGGGRGVHPRYTRYYGVSGNAVQDICHDSLKKWREWDAAIEAWQKPILEDSSLPEWYKTALFNELYYIVAGGSLWVDREESHASKLAHQIVIPRVHKYERPHSLQEDKEFAKRIFDDFITLTENMEKGIMIHHREDKSVSGRIVFSPDEIQYDVLYLTDNGNTLIKTADGTVTLADRITLYTNEEPNSPPISPRKASASDGEEEETSERSLFDYGEYGMYLYLEGQEYLMYNTYDVHFYASFALISLWPELELNIQRSVARSTLIHSPNDQQWMLHSNEMRPRKLRGAVPHDIGTPSLDPLYLVNSYCIHDVNDWKDLNSKFTLQVYRDYIATEDLEFLNEVYPVVWESMHYLERFDLNRDGMIENTGFPDQTYDTWTATGASAYCGGLWVAALSAMVEMAKILNKEDDQKYYEALYEKAFKVYGTLFNGEFFRYDTSGKYDDIIMADQLAGQWYARACNLPPIADPEHIKTALRCVFDYNVMSFKEGKLGAVNGFNKPLNIPDYSYMQSSEIWTGTNFGLIASMLQEGLEEEAWKTANSLYECIYKKFQYWYQTPEAWDAQGRYRSYAYMRPLAIWSIQWALSRKNKNSE